MSERFHLFERVGVELEYMIVDRESLDVRPLADRVLHAIAGAYESEVELNGLSWSNELVLHVIELKTNGPAPGLDGLADAFQHDAARINQILEPLGACLMPTSMHPWMNPHAETKLWPHEYSPVYETFHRIFDCRGHGWSNVQATHINLPFADDVEFGRLHAAIRLLLPLLPALAASSPLSDGRMTRSSDTRLEHYRSNARRIPSVTGRLIPEPVFTRADYDEQILGHIYRDLAPHDPEGVLRCEWANARGAIARFERNTIEIRVLDIQECPQADLAILGLIVAVLRALVDERWCGSREQQAWTIDPLEAILLETIRHADRAVIRDRRYLEAFGMRDRTRVTAGALWQHLFEIVSSTGSWSAEATGALGTIFREGCLAHRIARAAGDAPDPARLRAVYRALSDCLAEGRTFHGV